MAFGFFSVIAVIVLLAGGIAVLPALFVVGAVVLALSIAFHLIGFVFRLFGWLLLAIFAIPAMLLAGGVALAFGVAILHAALPLLLVIGVVWLIAHHHHRQPPALPRSN
jgi:hypothetical protein